jgi:copper chaperone CopZ
MRWIAVAPFAICAAACAGQSGWSEGAAVPERASCTVELAVPNMACGEVCPGKVRQALASVRGVQEVSVDFGSRSAAVVAEYPACSGDGFEEMIENLHDLGYEGQVVSSY